MPLVEYVRVKDRETRHEFTISRSSYEADKAPYELLEKDATSSDGAPLPAKPHILSNPNTAGQKAEPDKENS